MDVKRIRDERALLDQNDPPVVDVSGAAAGSSAFVLLGDHAGNAFPRGLKGLGLSPEDRSRHIAVDIGSRLLGLKLSQRLGAPFVSQTYSRLLVDCNRAPDRPDAILEVSDGTIVPGNQDLNQANRQFRVAHFHETYHAAIARIIEDRRRANTRTVLVSLHSFTPVLQGIERPWQIGVLHKQNSFALRVLRALQRSARFAIGDNQPYCFDETDYTIARHAFPHDLDWVELEIRQDVLQEPGSIDLVAACLEDALRSAELSD